MTGWWEKEKKKEKKRGRREPPVPGGERRRGGVRRERKRRGLVYSHTHTQRHVFAAKLKALTEGFTCFFIGGERL